LLPDGFLTSAIILSNSDKQKTAGVIIIGNEILSGRTQDLNISYIGKNLEKLGIVLAEVIIIPDVEATIINKVKDYSENYNYVFTTGGIGPTHDDITTESIAKAFNVKLLRNSDAVACMERYYEPGTLTEARLKMTDIPEGASLIDNPVSGAPGIHINNVFILAGVPKIMQAMLDTLTGSLVGGPPILTSSVCTNLTESKLAEGMTKIQNECEEVSIGSYPYFKRGKLGVNIVLRSIDKTLLLQQTDLIKEFINGVGGKVMETMLPE
jgi:molybdenum cofactor synthesis domain-containing protein